jgi:GH25 family lysozyme M1 (1,4-beta-N-acetylmuramidase)
MSNPIVLDISHHQPDPIDWAKLKANGTVGIIHKATEGTGHVDDKLFSRARAAMDAGLCWSTYHFLRPASDITQQIKFYLDTLDPRQGERVCLDHEDAGVSLDQLKQAVKYIRDTRPDLQVTIYSGHVIEEQLRGACDVYLAENTSLWTCEYGDSTPEWCTGTWPQWSLFQYSENETAVGINGPVDGNKWNGTTENLIKWFGPAGEEPAPAPEPEPAEHIDIAIVRSSPNVLVSITLDGELVVASTLETA